VQIRTFLGSPATDPHHKFCPAYRSALRSRSAIRPAFSTGVHRSQVCSMT